MSRYDVYGALGSPYSMKVRAAMRAKRLVHTWTGMTAEDRQSVMPNVRAPVIPVIRKPDGQWTNDSTPFLLSLEGEGRDLLPPSPVARFACLLFLCAVCAASACRGFRGPWLRQRQWPQGPAAYPGKNRCASVFCGGDTIPVPTACCPTWTRPAAPGQSCAAGIRICCSSLCAPEYCPTQSSK